MAEPLVSAIIPTKNRSSLCIRAVESVLAQTHPNIECIVVDDGSTDGTAEALAAKFGDRICVLRNEVSQGVAAARNRALILSRGEYVAFLDSDDEWLPRKIERQLALAARGAAVVYCRAMNISPEGKVLGLQPARYRGDVSRALLWNNVAGSPSAVLVRRSALAEFDPPFRSGIYSEDWDLWLRLSFRHRFDFDPEVQVRIENDMASRHRAMKPDALRASMREIFGAAAKDPVSAETVQRLHRRVESTIAYFVGAQHLLACDRRAAAPLLLRSLVLYPWQLRVFRSLAVLVAGTRLTSFARGLRAWFHGQRHREAAR